MILGDGEKRVFKGMLDRLLEFTGIRCVTYCLMANHFHILLEIGEEEKERFATEAEAGGRDAEVCSRVRALYGKKASASLAKDLAELRASGKGGEAWDRLSPLVGRMGDLSTIMKELKWRFSAWYNKKNGRVGTLWESRYHSVLIEGSEEALAATAAYIDLNPVRAGVARDPKDYRFCAYAEAVAKDGAARSGLRIVVAGGDGDLPWQTVLSRYRLSLFGRGRRRRDADGRLLQRGFTDEEVERVEGEDGVLALHELLRCRVRYMTQGAAVGGRAFLDRLLEARPEFFGSRRKTGGSKMRGGDWGGLHAVRDLQNAVTRPE
ncbi:hypothetical protein BH23VER1_BH23VER1_11370 [soil metagenome]